MCGMCVFRICVLVCGCERKQLCFGGDHIKGSFLSDKGVGCILGLLRYPSKRFAAMEFLKEVSPLLVPAPEDEADPGAGKCNELRELVQRWLRWC